MALRLAEGGFAVFPLKPGAKTPLIRNWVKDATADPVRIIEWWNKTPGANLGLSAAGLVIIDLDPAKDGSPNPWPQDPRQRADLGRAPTQATPRGGTHHLFRLPAGRAFKNSAGKLAPGVDVRTDGGYIVFAPSNLEPSKDHPGGAYRLVVGNFLPHPANLPEPPAWLIEALEAAEAPKPNKPTPTPGNPPGSAPASKKLERARAWLAKAEPAIDGQGGHKTAFRVASALFEKFDLTPAEAWDALQEWNGRCQPPWSERELQHKIEDANAKYQGPRGTLLAAPMGYREQAPPQGHPQGELIQTEGNPAEEPPTGPKAVGTPLAELRERYGALEWIWPKWIAKGMLHLVTGDSGAGKTTMLYDVFAMVHGGAPFPDQTTAPTHWQKRPALYIDADLRASHQLSEIALRYEGDAPKIEVFEIKVPGDPIPRTVSTWEDERGLFFLLTQLLQAKNYWCLAVDTATRFAGSSRLEVASELTRWVGPLQRIARDLGLPVFLLGHANAGGTALGRHLVGACQIGWHIAKDGKLTQARSYGAPAKPLKFEFTETGPLAWEDGGDLEEPSELGQSFTLLETWILDRLRELAALHAPLRDEHNSWSALKDRAIADGAVKSNSTWRRALEKLEKSKAIESKECKGPKGGRFTRYALPGGWDE